MDHPIGDNDFVTDFIYMAVVTICETDGGAIDVDTEAFTREGHEGLAVHAQQLRVEKGTRNDVVAEDVRQQRWLGDHSSLHFGQWLLWKHKRLHRELLH